MPRFLNTFTGEFESHDDPSKVAYAILSHTWQSRSEGGEQSYSAVLKLQSEVAEPWKGSHSLLATSHADLGDGAADLPHPFFAHPKLSDKTKGICEVARSAGYRLLWFDACCIDKSNSAEVSTSLNSMYDWYGLANVCFVYLPDVPDGEDPTRDGSKFRASRWHTRGWTLQELIAPERVVFLSRTWNVLGTKLGLAPTLEEITGIDFDVLTGRDTPDAVSVAKRMAWAAGRETKFVEDRAYALLGIFGVHIAPIYGEGNNAFLRLQEEIIKTIPDQSIFAWGQGYTLRSLGEGSAPRGRASAPGLFAESPSDFREVGAVTSLSPSAFARRLGWEGPIPSLHSVFTPQGVHAQFLCVDLTRIPQIYETFFSNTGRCESCMRRGHAHALALLQCEDEEGSLIALPLRRTRSGDEDEEGLAVATHVRCHDPTHVPFHILRLPKAVLASILQSQPLTLQSVSVLRHYAPPSVSKSREPGFAHEDSAGIALWPGDREDGVVFQIAPWCKDALRALGFTIAPLQYDVRSKRRIIVSTSLLGQDARMSPQHLTSASSSSDNRDPASLRESPPSSPVQGGGSLRIRLRLTLELMDEYDGESTTASFFPQVSHTTLSDAESNHAPAARFSTSAKAVAMSYTTISADTTESRRTSPGTFHASATTEHVLASFAEHIDVDGSGDAGEGYVRLLRATLERPVDSSVARDRHTLWVSVELSDRYRYMARTEAPPRIPPSLVRYGEISGDSFFSSGTETETAYASASFRAPLRLPPASSAPTIPLPASDADSGAEPGPSVNSENSITDIVERMKKLQRENDEMRAQMEALAAQVEAVRVASAGSVGWALASA